MDKNTFIETYKELYPEQDRMVSCKFVFTSFISRRKIFDNRIEFSTLFNVIDTNHDNSIDFSEFLFLAAIGNQTGSLEDRLDIIFDL